MISNGAFSASPGSGADRPRLSPRASPPAGSRRSRAELRGAVAPARPSGHSAAVSPLLPAPLRSGDLLARTQPARPYSSTTRCFPARAAQKRPSEELHVLLGARRSAGRRVTARRLASAFSWTRTAAQRCSPPRGFYVLHQFSYPNASPEGWQLSNSVPGAAASPVGAPRGFGIPRTELQFLCPAKGTRVPFSPPRERLFVGEGRRRCRNVF